jgi:hypothetical protein
MNNRVQLGEYGAELEHDLGLNVLQRMLTKGLAGEKCDELECMSYNVSLDFSRNTLR